ncbi:MULTISPECIES: uracil phosphoribosyltransferase [Deefgea]|uniref:Uracil phosphoribosyltransferase n=1 Tax=Deefgea chitinilytica TaxID=570276 RepID=A0ABS2C7R6_9NEIS|nr:MULTISPECIES: uracil phosphoribosyltransferase [Deefgea]MBM5570199.1 uracil phosphoribosyltransferase [Deefgea chitinilytica]MBM9887428.1 uracil phosphoribosyltransferase [Deefgea sp. CFH1-16]
MQITIVHHPLVQHKLALLREAEVSTNKFRLLTEELARLLAYEATRDLPLEDVTIQGWCGDVQVQKIKGKKLTVVPILRAGLGMLNGVLDLVPSAKISVVGLARDEETLQPVPYFEKFVGDLEDRLALIIDPMLATGGSLVATVDMLKRNGCKEIIAIVMVAAPEGVKLMNEKHPDVQIVTASLDSHLNEQGYIIPGLGDAGDKIFGTINK